MSQITMRVHETIKLAWSVMLRYAAAACVALVLPLGLASCKADSLNEAPNEKFDQVTKVVLDSPDGVRRDPKEREICSKDEAKNNMIKKNLSLRKLSEKEVEGLFSGKIIKIKFDNNGISSSEVFKTDGEWYVTLSMTAPISYEGIWKMSSNEIYINSSKFGKICRSIFIDSSKKYYMEPIYQATHDEVGKIFPISFNDISKYIK